LAVSEDEKERRIVRARPPRPAADQPLGDPQAPAEPPEPRGSLAAGSEQFGRGTLPEGVATALQALGRLKPRDEAASVAFGAASLTIEHRYGLVTLVLPDGTRVTGTPEQAIELAHVLLGSIAPKR
jgi:hypothetical protein